MSNDQNQPNKIVGVVALLALVALFIGAPRFGSTKFRTIRDGGNHGAPIDINGQSPVPFYQLQILHFMGDIGPEGSNVDLSKSGQRLAYYNNDQIVVMDADSLTEISSAVAPGYYRQNVVVNDNGDFAISEIDLKFIEGEIYANLSLRDFSINAMALDLSHYSTNYSHQDLIDPFAGIKDIQTLSLLLDNQKLGHENLVKKYSQLRLLESTGYLSFTTLINLLYENQNPLSNLIIKSVFNSLKNFNFLRDSFIKQAMGRLQLI